MNQPIIMYSCFSAYRSLLQCIALKYVQDGEECSNWNMMRHHFEQIALKAKLKLNRNQVKHCISGKVILHPTVKHLTLWLQVSDPGP